MCIITYGFISKAKHHLSSIEYKPLTNKDFNLQTAQNIVINQMFCVSGTSDIYDLGTHYYWVKKHWKKIVKASLSKKWNDGNVNYSQSNIKKTAKHVDNLVISTNLFGKKFDTYYYAENGKLVHEQPSTKKHAKTLDNFEIVKFTNITSYMFEKSYLKTLHKKTQADKSKALANIQLLTLDFDKCGTYICVVMLNDSTISQSSLGKIAIGEIKKEIGDMITSQRFGMYVTSTIINATQPRL